MVTIAFFWYEEATVQQGDGTSSLDAPFEVMEQH